MVTTILQAGSVEGAHVSLNADAGVTHRSGCRCVHAHTVYIAPPAERARNAAAPAATSSGPARILASETVLQ